MSNMADSEKQEQPSNHPSPVDSRVRGNDGAGGNDGARGNDGAGGNDGARGMTVLAGTTVLAEKTAGDVVDSGI